MYTHMTLNHTCNHVYIGCWLLPKNVFFLSVLLSLLIVTLCNRVKWKMVMTKRITDQLQETLMNSNDQEDNTQVTSYALMKHLRSWSIHPNADGEETEGYITLNELHTSS